MLTSVDLRRCDFLCVTKVVAMTELFRQMPPLAVPFPWASVQIAECYPYSTQMITVHEADLNVEQARQLRDWLNKALPAEQQSVSPTAWMKGHVSHLGPSGPDEYDVECVYGDDPPPGDGWTPLYRHPPQKPAHEREPPHCPSCSCGARDGGWHTPGCPAGEP